MEAKLSSIRLLLLLGTAMTLGLSGCADSGNQTLTSASTADPVDYQSLGTPNETVEARLDRLEKNIADLRIEYSVMAPAIKQVEARNEQQEQRLAAFEEAFGPMTASINHSAPLPAKTAPAASPDGAMKPIPELSELRGVSPDTTGQDTTAHWGVHLESYRSMEAARKGWKELQATYPDLLAGLDMETTIFDAGDKGVYLRLLAGPFNERQDARKLCTAFAKRATWCEVLKLDASAPVASR
ncbi:MAG: hypothetical protein GC184_12470 [Rhizobiales bacterium]|nr:hypothetical protein [Hyphomicrobiales bacterium]